ncbi:asparagine synthase-related protein [Streptosporangium soli]|nr:asparagine synthase-related protein [Streptosporangium sp. KLBMP 9127]
MTSGEVWFAVLPDGAAGLAAARALSPHASQAIPHASGRPWLLGRWPREHVKLAVAGAVRVAVIGRCPATATDLTPRLPPLREVEDVEQVVAGLPGSFHLVASVGGRVRVRGTASAVRRVFTARVGDATVAANRSDLLAEAIGPRVDERVLATRLLPSGSVHPLADASVWAGVTGVPPDHCLLIEPDGRSRTRRWWTAPAPALPLAEGSTVVRRALTAAIGSCTAGGGTISADLSGGLGSTSLCFLAVNGRARLVTAHVEEMDPPGDGGVWARRAAAALPAAEHLTATAGPVTHWSAGASPIEEPGDRMCERVIPAGLAERMIAKGSRLHLTGRGGDELFSPVPGYLHDLVRSRPLTALRHIHAQHVRERRPLWPLLRDLCERTSFERWLVATAGGLGASPATADPTSTAWGPVLSMPPWATPDAVLLARDLLGEIAGDAPRPLSPRRGQHAALRSVRTAGDRLRRLDQATSRTGLPHAAPYLDDAVIEAVLSVRVHERGSLPVAVMKGIMPAPLPARRTKGVDGAAVRECHGDLLELSDGSLLAGMGLIDAGALRDFLLGLPAQARVPASLARTLACEIWLRSRQAATVEATSE